MKKKIASVLLALSCLVTSGCSFLPVGQSSGLSILSTNINDAGELIITYSDGTMANLGKVVGEKGDKGDRGEQGIRGERGPQGISGVIAPTSGYFALEVDSATGDLYCVTEENANAPTFSLDGRGNLYYEIKED